MDLKVKYSRSWLLQELRFSDFDIGMVMNLLSSMITLELWF